MLATNQYAHSLWVKCVYNLFSSFMVSESIQNQDGLIEMIDLPTKSIQGIVTMSTLRCISVLVAPYHCHIITNIILSQSGLRID